MYTAKAIGGYCTIFPCIGIQQGGWWEPERKIESVEVGIGSRWPNAFFEHRGR